MSLRRENNTHLKHSKKLLKQDVQNVVFLRMHWIEKE